MTRTLWARDVGYSWVALEFKKEDAWVGAFWTHDADALEVTEVWVCLVPCFPLHLVIDWADLRRLPKPRAWFRRQWASLDLSGPWTKPWKDARWWQLDRTPGLEGIVRRFLGEQVDNAVDEAILGTSGKFEPQGIRDPNIVRMADFPILKDPQGSLADGFWTPPKGVNWPTSFDWDDPDEPG